MHFFDRLADRIATADSVVSVGLDPDPARLPDSVLDADLPRWRSIDVSSMRRTNTPRVTSRTPRSTRTPTAGGRSVRPSPTRTGRTCPSCWTPSGVHRQPRRSTTQILDEDEGPAADAITVNPFLGRDSLEPFLQRADRGVFVLGRTSNPGGEDLQDLELDSGELYERVAASRTSGTATRTSALSSARPTPTKLERSANRSRTFRSRARRRRAGRRRRSRSRVRAG